MLLEPAPSLYGTQHNSTTTPASVSFSLSFVHAAACSALIASVRKISTTSNNFLGTKPSSRSSTPITINPLRIKQIQREKKKAALKSQKFSTSFDSSYSTSSYKTESPRNPGLCLSPAPVATRMRLKSLPRDCTFSRSLPTPAHSPKRMDAYTFSQDVSKCQMSTPKKATLPRRGQKGTGSLSKHGESFSYAVSPQLEKQGVPLSPIIKGTLNKKEITYTEKLPSSQKEKTNFSEPAVVSHESSSSASVSSPSKIGHPLKHKQGSTSSSITIFQKIFRSKSEDILDKDAKKSPAKNTNAKKNIVDEVLTSALLSPLIFRRSRSEDFLNKVIDRPEVKKYSVKDSKCLNSKEITSGKVKRPRISKPLRTFLPTDPPSIGETLKNKIKMSKSHNFNEDDACVPSRFFLEKSLPDDSARETTEKRYPTLQRPASNKETHFPASVKSSKHLRKNEPMRVYRVNQPKDVYVDNPLNDNCDIPYTQRATKEDTKQTCLTTNDPGKGTDSFVPAASVYSQTFSKKSPWFEKFKKSRLEVQNQKDEGNENDELNDSFGSSVVSSGSDDSTHEGYCKSLGMSPKTVLNTTYPQSKYVLTRYRGRPDVRRRVAEKLNAVIRELEEEMRMIHPGSTYPSEEENLYWNDPCGGLPLPTDAGLHRPTSLLIRKHAVHRRNSAPMLSPIEEVKVSPTSADLESMTMLQRSLAKCSSFSGDKLRRNNAPSHSPTKDSLKAMKLEFEESLISQKGSCKAQESKRQGRPTLILPPSETQPGSLVNPDPTSYCSQYGSENDIDYV